jgi:hypothetical protein
MLSPTTVTAGGLTGGSPLPVGSPTLDGYLEPTAWLNWATAWRT